MLGRKLVNICYQTAFNKCKVMSSNFSSLSVLHDVKNKEFYIKFPDTSEKGYLTYEMMSKSSIDLQHTFVPESLRGKGVAKLLAKAALDHVLEKDLQMKLTCWYIEKYVRENPSEKFNERIIT